MDVTELRQEELEELRESYYHQLLDCEEEVIGNIESAEGIDMSNVIAHYEGVYFVEEDFFCNIKS